MTKQEALKVLCDSCQFSNYETVMAVHEDTGTVISVSKFDIIVNLECNDYELNLDFIQDMCEENGEMFQGHSLSELFLI